VKELEVKFYLQDLRALRQCLKRLGSHKTQARHHEHNLRFDTPSGDLELQHQVLRLRRGKSARLTYKGPAGVQGGVSARREIEFKVSDYTAARTLLEHLGYQVSMIYEKYRTTYQLNEVIITLDEMPYGDFVELEGPNPESIQAVNQLLSLDWEARIIENYLVLFDRLRSKLSLTFHDLTFANFESLDVSPETLGVRPADQ
jgi:adenylate cyclase class 2